MTHNTAHKALIAAAWTDHSGEALDPVSGIACMPLDEPGRCAQQARNLSLVWWMARFMTISWTTIRCLQTELKRHMHVYRGYAGLAFHHAVPVYSYQACNSLFASLTLARLQQQCLWPGPTDYIRR